MPGGDEGIGGPGPEEKNESEWAHGEIALEYEIDRRFCAEVDYELSTERGTVGVLTSVRLCTAKNRRDQMSFVDAVNRCLLDCGAALARSSLPVPVVAEVADRLSVLCHVLSSLARFRFGAQAAAHFQRFVDELSRPLTGVLGILQRTEELTERHQEKRRTTLEGKLRRVPHTLLASIQRLGDLVIDPGDALAGEISRVLEHLREFIEAPQEDCVLVDPALLPPAEPEDALKVRLRAHRSTAQQWLPLAPTTSADDLRAALACAPSAASSARFLVRRKPPGKVRAHWDCQWTELPDDALLRDWVSSIPGCEALGADLHVEVDLPSEPAGGAGAAGDGHRYPQWLPAWPFPLWPGKYPILKVTVDSVTRMLVELRSAYEEPDFQREYKELRRAGGMTAHVEKALSVQCDIVQRFGFAGNLTGVEEMRKQATYWSNTDFAVRKLLADIHNSLEYGKPRRRVLVPTSLPRARAGRVPLGAWWPTEPSEKQAAALREAVEDACRDAARKIAEADVLLLCTGAGFSADSGLAVYADVATVPVYADRGLEYHDLCTPRWLSREPELFWGFWGQCFNDYRETAPHEGYRIVARWADRKFRHSNVAEAIRFRLAESARSAQASSGDEAGAPPPYLVRDRAGAFFAFTSNVDAHHFDWFRACEIRECHGNIELYQCACRDGPCSAVWRAPTDFHFSVNKATMLAPRRSLPADRAAAAEPAEQELVEQQREAAPHVGHVRGGGRSTTLRHMPPASAGHDLEVGFATNHPACLSCQGPARPAVQMFGDTAWRDVPAQAARWDDWVSTVRELAAEEVVKSIVILEIGAGGRVTTVRKTSEQHLRTFRNAGTDVHLVRVNPDLPLGDSEALAPAGELSHRVTSIMAGGLQSLLKIDAALSDYLG